jgi:hypothetical protein
MDPASGTWTRAGRPLLILGAVFLVGLANALIPVLRFTSQTANWLAACLLFLLPILLPVFVLRFRMRALFKVFAMIGLTPIVLLMLAVSAMTGSCAHSTKSAGVDHSFARLAQAPMEGSRATAYLSNSGAMSDFLVVVRQEKTLLPGLLLVRNVYARSGERQATLTAVGPRAVEVRSGGVATRIDFRRFVYF